MGEVTIQDIERMIALTNEHMKDFISTKFEEHERVEILLNDKLDSKIENVKRSGKEVRGEVFGNGRAGLKTIVDRLWQDHSATLWWLRGVGITVVGKIIFDIVTK